MTLSEQSISAIARALLNERKALDESLSFWSTPGRIRRYPHSGAAINHELHENASALVELADAHAPWLKQRPDWPAITNSTPPTPTMENA